MSNRRKLLAVSQEPAERCSFCRHKIGKLADALRLRTGQVACPRCRQGGQLRKLACGHYSLPGQFIASDSDDLGNFQCVQCSPVAYQAGNARFGLARRPD